MFRAWLLFHLYFLAALPGYGRSSDRTNLTGKPGYFIENKGQITDQQYHQRQDIDFKFSAAKGLTVFVGKGKIIYQWIKADTSARSLSGYRMEVTLAGANTDAVLSTAKKHPYREQYFLPSMPAGRTATAYSEITYKNIYPAIDWVLYTDKAGNLEYDFVVRPGGNPASIQLRYSGATGIALTPDGSLQASTPLGEITDQAPYAFVTDNGRPVGCKFRLNADRVGFSVAPYQGTLLIDPVVKWATYFGGSEYDQIGDMVYNKYDSSLYITGTTNSLTDIATTGAFQTSFAGGLNPSGADAFLAKMDKDGHRLWATYYGGPDVDQGKKVAVDSTGVYIAGVTASLTGIATAASYQPQKAGDPLAEKQDAFLIKFDTAGTRLWGTYFGGSNHDGNTAMGLAADNLGHIYLAGNTQSTDILTTPGCYQPASGGVQDGFIARFSANGALDWATYYGGPSADYPYDLATDPSGNLLVAGRTQSTTGIATPGAYQPAIGGGQDGFIAKFDPAGQLSWSSYYGAAGLDRAYCVGADHSGNIYIAGTTSSPSGIATAGVHQEAFGGGSEDGFIAAFSPSGQRRWASYYGGPNTESAWGIYCQGDSSVYITGPTQSPDSIATPDGMQSLYGGGTDAFIAKLRPATGLRLWGSYYGGIDADEGIALAGTGNHILYLAGNTGSASGIATPAGYQPAFGGGDMDGFVACIKDCQPPASITSISGPATLCEGSSGTYSVTPAVSDSVVWILPAGWSGSSIGGSLSVTASGGSGMIKAVAVNNCSAGDTVLLSVTVSALPAVPLITRNGNVLSVPAIYSSYQWLFGGIAIPGANDPAYTVAADGIYTITVINARGCSATSAPVSITGTAISTRLVAHGITFYPNPAADVLHVHTQECIRVTLYSIEGKILLQEKMQPGTAAIGLGGLADGIYLLQVSAEDGCWKGFERISLKRRS